jgi:hypothetical protein
VMIAAMRPARPLGGHHGVREGVEVAAGGRSAGPCWVVSSFRSAASTAGMVCAAGVTKDARGARL